MRTPTLAALGSAGLVALALACASGGGVEIHSGVTYYADETAAPHERWDETWREIPIFVVMEGDGENGVRGPRALAIRDGVLAAQPTRHDLFQVVPSGSAQGDTLGSLLWLPEEGVERTCGMFQAVPGDSVNPTTFPCTRVETNVRESWRPTPIQRTVWEQGGNAVVLVGEEYSGVFRGLRGYVLRCPDSRDGPACVRGTLDLQ